MQRQHKVKGVPVPNVKVDLANVGRQIGGVARQVARLAYEVQAAREKAEQIGRAISR